MKEENDKIVEEVMEVYTCKQLDCDNEVEKFNAYCKSCNIQMWKTMTREMKFIKPAIKLTKEYPISTLYARVMKNKG